MHGTDFSCKVPVSQKNELYKTFKKNFFFMTSCYLQSASKKCFSVVLKTKSHNSYLAKTLFSHARNSSKFIRENLFICGVFDEKRDALKNFITKRRDPNKGSRWFMYVRGNFNSSPMSISSISEIGSGSKYPFGSWHLINN